MTLVLRGHMIGKCWSALGSVDCKEDRFIDWGAFFNLGIALS